MPEIRHIFLDDGGVMNDNSLRSPQWQQLIGEFFVPRFGETPEAWAKANERTFDDVWHLLLSRLEAWDVSSSYAEYAAIQGQYDIDWVVWMFREIGLEPPAGEDAQLALSLEARDYIMPRVHAEYPGAIQTIRQLAGRYAIYTSSQGTSVDLGLTLQGMGVVDCFHRLYGPDFVNCPKASAEFYVRIFADAGIDPAEALVLDDKPLCLSWAQEAGAGAVVLVSNEPPSDYKGLVIASLAELPSLMERGRLLE